MQIPHAGAIRPAAFLSLAPIIVVVLAVVGQLSVVRAQSEFPRELQRTFDLAEQKAFSGDFEGASKRVEESREWIRQEKNKLELRDAKFEWSSVSASALAFQGWVESERGNLARAAVLLRDAHRALKDLGRSFQAAQVCLQYGDFEFAQALTAIPTALLPEEIRDDLGKQQQQHFKKAKKLYEEAADIFVDVFPKDPKKLTDFQKRLRARSENALARIATAEGDFDVARRHLQESELMFRAMKFHKLFIAPDAKWPMTLKQVRTLLAESKDIEPQVKIFLETEYARIVAEWMRLRCDSAELELRQAELGERGPVADVEEEFSKVRDLSDENLGVAHPLRFRADVALGRFYIDKAREAAERAKAAPQGPEKDRLLRAERSYFLDAVFVVQDSAAAIREGGRLLPKHPLRGESLALELIAENAGYSIAGRERGAVVRELRDWLKGQ